MTAFVDLPQQLAAEIDAVLDAAAGLTCVPDSIVYTAGEPAYPSGQCTQIWVWPSVLFNIGNQIPLGRQGDETSCVIRPATTLNIRVDVCYEESPQGPQAEDHASTADCLHSLMIAIWCGLADLWVSGSLLALDCRAVAFGDFTVSERSGGIVSATLPITVETDCTDVAS